MVGTLLVVEDHEDNRRILRDLLRATGFELIEAHDGEAALERVSSERFDLILMDIQLPGIDGYEVARRVRAGSANTTTPIIAVTSYALTGDEDKARLAGCTDYVFKRFRPRELLAKIREYLPT
jgi:two-component system cell cycle response regulator DivK